MNKKFISNEEKTDDFSFFYKKKKAFSDFKKGMMVLDKNDKKEEISPSDPKFLIFYQIIKFKRFLFFLFLGCFLAFLFLTIFNTIITIQYLNESYKFFLNYFFNLLVIYFFLWSLFILINFKNLTATFNLLSWKKKEIVAEKSWFTDHILMVVPLLKKHINYFLLLILAFLVSGIVVDFIFEYFNFLPHNLFKIYLIFVVIVSTIFIFVFCWFKFLLFNFFDASKILFSSLDESSDNNDYGNYFSNSNYGLNSKRIPVSTSKKITSFKGKKSFTRSEKNKFDDDFIDVSLVPSNDDQNELDKIKNKLKQKKLKRKAKNKQAINWWFGID